MERFDYLWATFVQRVSDARTTNDRKAMLALRLADAIDRLDILARSAQSFRNAGCSIPDRTRRNYRLTKTRINLLLDNI
jgi:hypothetical protein